MLRLFFADRESLTETGLQNERAHTTQTQTQTQPQTLSFLHLWKLAYAWHMHETSVGGARGARIEVPAHTLTLVRALFPFSSLAFTLTPFPYVALYLCLSACLSLTLSRWCRRVRSFRGDIPRPTVGDL